MVGVKFRTLEQFTSAEEDGHSGSHDGTVPLERCMLDPWTGVTILQESEDIAVVLAVCR